MGLLLGAHAILTIPGHLWHQNPHMVEKKPLFHTL